MAKLMCKSCGGKVMAKGGTASKKALPKAQMGMSYGIPQTGTTNYSAPTMKRGGMKKTSTVKKMKLGGDPDDPKPSNSVLKNLGITGLAGGLMGLLTTEKGIKKRADNASARYMKRQTKKVMKK
jgi:hypothetical protein